MTSTTPPRRPALRAAAGLGLAFSLGVAALTGCSAIADAASAAGDSADETTLAATATSTETKPDDVQAVIDGNSDQTVVNDDEWSIDDAQEVDLADPTRSGVEASDDGVTITEAGVYRLTGQLDGTVTIDAPEDAQVVLVLDGVTIDAADAAAIQALSADDVAIFLADGSDNSVSSTGAYDEDADPNAAIWSDADLTISGTGSLSVDGSANDGITSKDDLVILSGTIDVTAADDGLRGKDSLTIRGGTVSVDAGGDGLQSDQDDDETKGWVLVEGGVLDITAGSDGIDGFTDAIVTGGAVSIASEEGFEAGIVAIGGGTIDIVATDDGINGSAGTAETDGTTSATSTDEADAGGEMPADGEFPADGERPTGGMQGGGMQGGGMQDSGEWILISGGEITIDAEGDGLDSNGSLEISGGTIIVNGPTNAGNGALDANGEIAVTGGTLLALDAGGMSETPSTDSAQAWVAAAASGDAGATIEIVADDGTVLYSGEAAKAFGAVLYSGEDVTAGANYTITVDGSEAATATTGEALAGGMGGPRG
ncbi:carbohydrate-binding domain-containing protein [Microbacterium karelineae]|uniref:carbohydrate-binding domain-containing protein n=1 Tax=Microbacterium karelineae TaxID=2654283 RepID=UPI0012EA1538|nr:carbohydrate-binding domain-containing protein [Microbacterium karelineae]